MSRALLIILAILAAVVAAVLDVTLLYFLSLALVAIAAVLWLVKMKGKFDVGKPSSSGYAPAASDDLSSFGILEIRPKARNGIAAAGSAQEGESHQASLFGGDTESEVVAPPDEAVDVRPDKASSEVAVASPVRKKAPAGRFDTFSEANHRTSSTYQMISVLEGHVEDVLAPCLESLASALGANTVGLFSTDGETRRIVAIVSQNAYARGAGALPVTSEEPFKTPRKSNVEVESVSEASWDVTDLKYYRGEIAVKELARTRVPTASENEQVVLLADAVRRGVLSTAQSRRLLKQYARVFGTLLQADTSSRTEDGSTRPRREIIAEEIDMARKDGRPLALAIVMLNRADEFDDADGMARAEGELVEYLRSDGLRAERFGDLMVGVFHHAPVTDVEHWASRVQGELAASSGMLRGGVSVGVAMMNERHSTAERLRADAAAALQEAVESGACTILE